METGVKRRNVYQYFIWGLLVVILIFLGSQIVLQSASYKYGYIGSYDFIEYWSAGRLFIAGENPYNVGELFALQKQFGYSRPYAMIMWNPPWLLLWTMPLVFLPFNLAAMVWLFINTILVLLSGFLIWKSLETEGSKTNKIIPAVATMTFVPVLVALGLGQMSTLLLLGTAGFFYFMKKGNSLPAGMFLALTTVKPHVVYLLWIAVAYVIIMKRNWRLLAGIVIVMAPSIGTLFLVSPKIISYYQNAITTPPLYWTTPTIGTFLHVTFFNDLEQVRFIPSIITGLLLAGYLLKKSPDFVWQKVLPALLIISLPTAPFGWSFDQVVLLVPYLYIIAELIGHKSEISLKKRVIIFFGLCITDVIILTQRVFTKQINEHLPQMLGQFGYSADFLNTLRISHEFCYLWVPFAIGCLFLVVHRQRK